MPLREAKKHAPPLPETNPEDPGPFAFADDARVRSILSAAGFADVAVTPVDLDLDIAIGRGTGRRRRRGNGNWSDEPAFSTASPSRPRGRGGGHPQGSRRAREGDSVPLGAAIWMVTAVNPR